jgi:DNA-directed RNA polymerase subunit M/transcription elongation factor TFIIS
VVCSKTSGKPKQLSDMLPLPLGRFEEARELGFWLEEEDALSEAEVLSVAVSETPEEEEEELEMEEEPEPEALPEPVKKPSRSRAAVSRMLQVINEASPLHAKQQTATAMLRKAFPSRDATELQKSLLHRSLQLASDMQVLASWELPICNSIYDRQLFFVCSNAAAIGDADLATVQQKQLRPERWKPLIAQRVEHERQQELDKTASMSTVQCIAKSCRSVGTVTYMDLQTRGGDEGMTTFYTCTKCNCVWKR